MEKTDRTDLNLNSKEGTLKVSDPKQPLQSEMAQISPMSEQQPMVMNAPPNMMMPPNPDFFGGMIFFYANSPMQELANAKKALVKQRFEPWETTGCETPNQYYIFTEDKDGVQKYLFVIKESATCCCLHFSPGWAHPFILLVQSIFTDNGKEIKEDFAYFERPCKCTCFKTGRPELQGRLAKGEEGSSIGRVVEKFNWCCDPEIQIFNKDNQHVWSITCNCCQCGYCCKNLPCGRCSEVKFEIQQPTALEEKESPGRIQKLYKGCLSIMGDADFFDVYFPEGAPSDERFMMIMGTILLDYVKFEDKDRCVAQQKRRRRHHHFH